MHSFVIAACADFLLVSSNSFLVAGLVVGFGLSNSCVFKRLGSGRSWFKLIFSFCVSLGNMIYKKLDFATKSCFPQRIPFFRDGFLVSFFGL